MAQQPDPLDSLIASLETQAQRANRSRGADAVHDLRVSIRRLLQAIELYRATKKARKPLRHLMSLAGAVRDCDIAGKLLAEPWAKGSERLRQRVAERRKSSRRMLVAELKSWLQGKAEWRASLGAHVAPSASYKALHELPKLADEFLRRGKRVAVKNPDPADLHKFRIHTKELRYSLELMQPAIGPAADAWVEPIKAVQSALGDVNDYRIVRDLAEGLGGGNGVDGVLRKRMKKRIRKFLHLWREHFSGGAAKQWVRALEPPARKPMARSNTVAAATRAAKQA